MAESSAFSSNNPFRRKAATSSSSGAPPLPPTAADPGVSSSPPPAVVDPSRSLHSALLPASEYFRTRLQETHPNPSRSTEPPPPTTFPRPKIVKKVRVQSPPPSSPESATAVPDNYPGSGYGDEESSDGSSDVGEEAEDPFQASAPPLSLLDHSEYGIPTSTPRLSDPPPPNPFKRTLEDIEQARKGVSQIPNIPVGRKGPFDVDSLRKSLLTGQASIPGSGPPAQPMTSPQPAYQPAVAGDAGSVTDASSVSRQSIFDSSHAQETPRTSHEISEPEGADDQFGLIKNPYAKTQLPPSALRKKPPPPSSRHGKFIKVDLSQADKDSAPTGGIMVRPSSSSSETAPSVSPTTASPTRQQPSSPSNVNKPLPPAPRRVSLDGDPESVFDKEAAGKVPEPDPGPELTAELPIRPATLPATPHASLVATASQTPMRKPAPPPRRNPHRRSESKASVTSKITNPQLPAVVPTTEEPEALPGRSSMDSVRSRSSSLRVNVQAPAPPPPRRPNHGSRPSTSVVSPSAPPSNITHTNAITASASPFSDQLSSPLETQLPPVNSSPTSIARAGSPNLNVNLNAIASSSIVPVPLPLAAMPPVSAPQAKLVPPPRPPTRNPSVRSSHSTGRPASVSGLDATSRRVSSREKDGNHSTPSPVILPPPPPPKRSRGASRGSQDGSGQGQGGPRRTSGDSVRSLGGLVVEKPAEEARKEGQDKPATNTKPKNILEDLNALQREVDAVREKYEKSVKGSVAGG